MLSHTLEFKRRLLLLLVPLLLVTASVLWWIYRAESTSVLDLIKADEEHAVELAGKTLLTEINLIRGDALYLARLTSLHQWLDTNSDPALDRVNSDLIAYSRYRGLYDQVRYIDETGYEVARINWAGGNPVRVTRDKLQDKSDRDYFIQTQSLLPGAIYTSPLDLNIENGEIEQPIKPMIRLSTPVFDQQGKNRGIIVLNYFGDRLLNQIKDIRSQIEIDLWLLNEFGYWLVGPDPEKEWGFMYEDKQNARVDVEHRDLWLSLQRGGISNYIVDEDLIYYLKVESPESLIDDNNIRWTLIAHVPGTTIAEKIFSKTRHLLVAFIALVILLIAFSCVMTKRDVQRRISEAMVRQNEARFRDLLDSAPDAIVIVDQQGIINLINSQAEKGFGYSRDELIGENIEILIPDQYRDEHIQRRREYVRDPVSRQMGIEKELKGLRKDGTDFPVEISLSPLESEQGLLFTSIIRDITARKQAEEAQRMVQERYRELVTDLPVGVYRSAGGEKGCFVEVNPAMLDIFEADNTEELLNTVVNSLYISQEQRGHFKEKITDKGFVKAEEMQLKTLKGREFFAAVTAVMKMDEFGQVYYDGMIEDISDRKESELRIFQLNERLRQRSTELESINRELEAFSYSVSHDLRAPLRAMDGFSRSLLNEYSDRLDDNGKDRLTRVRAAAQRMAQLIDDLLSLSRVSRSEVKREPIDLGKIASEVVEELLSGDPRREIEISIQPDLKTNGDARLLRVLLDNLIGNAWKFTGKRHHAFIELGQTSGNDESVYFVRDNGAGFNMEYSEKLFGAFQRLHDTGEYPGTGIGLATVKRVINKHGGRIWAESRVDEGATFYFTLDHGEYM